MSNFDSTKVALKTVLDQIIEGKVQLPDFQRGWVWDDEHIRSLLVSIARSFPVGAVMFLETGGSARFQIRPVEGVSLPAGAIVEKLILDGQQRLTSLTQVLRLQTPVKTRDAQKREVERFYYFNIEHALNGNSAIEEAIVGLDGDKQLTRNFGRDVVLDLSSQEKEFSAFYFPCNQILDSDGWEEGLMAFDPTRFARYMQFRGQVLSRFRDYYLPVIQLTKDNGKEAVCLVFEKVNTGGVPLSVFELMTASYAADGFNLRDDWFGNPARGMPGRQRTLAAKSLLSTLLPTDFLQGIALLHSHSQRAADLQAGRTGKDVTAVSAKREQILVLPLDAYQTWADKLTAGFLAAERFLRMEGFRKPTFLPYRSQLVPLAAIIVRLGGERWLEPVIKDKLARWFWCGVFGELYGGAIETRIALDLQGMVDWIETPGAPEPATVVAAGFQASRLDTLRTRTSAAYRGLYVLLQREGSEDFFWKARMVDLDHDDCAIDIHHIFPKAWCEDNHISERVFNSIVNKTPISYKANRMIGGKAPSKYLDQLRTHAQVQITAPEQDDILRSHLINPALLRADDFQAAYQHRRQELLALIELAMGKDSILAAPDGVAEDELEEPAEGAMT